MSSPHVAGYPARPNVPCADYDSRQKGDKWPPRVESELDNWDERSQRRVERAA